MFNVYFYEMSPRRTSDGTELLVRSQPSAPEETQRVRVHGNDSNSVNSVVVRDKEVHSRHLVDVV